ncbi:MAG: NUDIX domain-containing protein [Planctomycetota bacterium]|jgi:alkylhydroperoxidase/carboxymuconolactone decarboxylase family protein YurZ/ADP-ribose pyrophosphatase YjhB (NUDIX family)
MAMLGPPEPSGFRDAVFGCCEIGGRILLVLNPRAVGPAQADLWDLPGGVVRPGESLVQALRREWKEETGLVADVGSLLLVTDGVKRRRPDGPALYRWRAFTFSVRSRGTPRAGPGIVDAAWVDRDEAVRRLDAPYHERLRSLLAGDPSRYGQVEWVDPVPAVAGDATEASGDALRRLLAMVAAAAGGDAERVAEEVRAALADGTPGARIEETLLQIVPYAGFPRAIAAFQATRPLLGAGPSAATPLPAPDVGEATFAAVYGDTTPRVADGLRDLHPDLLAWTLSFAYGRVLSRGALTLLERELLAVSTLTALGALDDPLLGHMRAALRLGADRADLVAAVAAVPHGLGELRRERARALISRAERGGTNPA